MGTRDIYGGWTAIHQEPTGFFRLGTWGNRSLLFTPEGNGFYLFACNRVAPWVGKYEQQGYQAVYGGDRRAWGAAQLERLRAWGFTGLGHQADERLLMDIHDGTLPGFPYTVLLPFLGAWSLGRTGADFPDVFDPYWERQAERVVQRHAAAVGEDPWCLGYFMCNEPDLDWSGRRAWRSRWARRLIGLPADAPGRQKFESWLEGRYGDIGGFNLAHGTAYGAWSDVGREEPPPPWTQPPWVEDLAAFTAAIAETFFRIVGTALRTYDPRHLILGARFGGDAESEVAVALAPYADVVSVNHYPLTPQAPTGLYDRLHRITGLPLYHSEWSFCEEGRADSGNGPLYPSVPTQEARGWAYRTMAEDILAHPQVVGWGWQEWCDPEGAHSEGLNFGVCDWQDTPYSALTEACHSVHTDYVASLLGGNPVAIE